MVIMNVEQTKRELQRLYTGRATVYAYSYEKGNHGSQVKTTQVLYEDIPCRRSYDRKVVNDQDTHGLIIQDITMYCDPDSVIPSGSRTAITQDGRTEAYMCSSQPAVYECHQEVELTAYRERA